MLLVSIIYSGKYNLQWAMSGYKSMLESVFIKNKKPAQKAGFSNQIEV